MDDATLRKIKDDFLNQKLFQHLQNTNDGFDTPSISYFFEADFERLLHRVQELGIGLYGIEPWLNGEYYGVETFEDYSEDPTDPTWYFTAFEKFKSKGLNLNYSASYHVDEEMLEEFVKNG